MWHKMQYGKCQEHSVLLGLRHMASPTRGPSHASAPFAFMSFIRAELEFIKRFSVEVLGQGGAQ